ncbi:MAG: adenylosuccinate synthetase [Opitutales bacterium]
MSLTPFKSHLIADVGVTLGDEGKGRLIPELIDELRHQSGQADPVGMVLKVNGGANSGHTAGGLKLNLLPAGVIEADVGCLALGAGVVADPRKLLWELAYVEMKGHAHVRPRLRIDQRCQVSDLCHRLLDLACEHYRGAILGEEARGSTGRGITPAYLDEAGQFQIHYADFLGGRADYARKLSQRADRACRTIEHVYQLPPEKWAGLFDTLTAAETRANAETLDAGALSPSDIDFIAFNADTPFRLNVDALIEAYWQAGQRLRAHISDVREAALETLLRDRYLIGEFGQSFWLDKRAGFSPNVTASHTYTPELFQSAGIPIQPVHTVGCCKAYDTKVGTHVFLTRIDDAHPLAARLKKLEFGTSTGRQRMVGWFDAVEKGDALRYGGFDDLVINKLDALSLGDDWPEGNLLICTGYADPDGAIIPGVPRDDAVRKALQPVYREVPGWPEDIRQARSWDDLPENAQRYVACCLQAVVECAFRASWEELPGSQLPNLRYVGVGPDPSQIIRDVPPPAELRSLANAVPQAVGDQASFQAN